MLENHPESLAVCVARLKADPILRSKIARDKMSLAMQSEPEFKDLFALFTLADDDCWRQQEKPKDTLLAKGDTKDTLDADFRKEISSDMAEASRKCESLAIG